MKRLILSVVLFVTFAVIPSAGQSGDNDIPLFSFGLLADVQYADADRNGKRDYRGSIERLENSVEIFNKHTLEFIIHAGDLIDRDYKSFQLPMAALDRAEAPVHYVIGNHEFAIADSLKATVKSLLKNPEGYYSFLKEGFQFVLLNTMDVSVMAAESDSRAFRRARMYLEQLKNVHANNAVEWNGAIGPRQMRWLKQTLKRGHKMGYRTLIFAHHPLLPENGLQAWNNKEVLRLLKRYRGVEAVITGHHHEGNYVQTDGIHHLTLKGLVEATASACGAIVEVYADRILIRGFGDQRDLVLTFNSPEVVSPDQISK